VAAFFFGRNDGEQQEREMDGWMDRLVMRTWLKWNGTGRG